ncbi:MAG: hypothetical protein IT376_07295 [Polyangiaceae bacterium]|nr:hypothetical protein [Polyangiaceae bacterium]
MSASLLALGCSSAEDSEGAELYSYGAGDVEQAVLGTWTGTWTPPGGAAGAFTVQLARPAGATTRPACGNRELGTLGPACIDMSSMTLAGVLDVEDGSFTAAPISGGLTVPGTELTELFLSLEGAGVRWSAEWARGAWTGCRANALDGTTLAACTLAARAP